MIQTIENEDLSMQSDESPKVLSSWRLANGAADRDYAQSARA